MTTLMTASRQWSERPPDQRFPSIEAMHARAEEYRQNARTASVDLKALSVVGEGDEVMVMGPQGGRAQLSHWAFGQLAARVNAPAGYLRKLPSGLAAVNLNHGIAALAAADDDRQARLLIHQNDHAIVRGINSERYTRIWNVDITDRLRAMKERGPWQEAPAAFDGSRGQYLSDHDMFSFFVDSERRIFDTLPGGGLSRGFFVWNSEVGASTFGIMTFLYEFICGNHRVWGATGIRELRVQHVGSADARAFAGLTAEYAEESVTEDERRIKAARAFRLGGTKDEVLDKVFSLRVPALSRVRTAEALTIADANVDRYGDPFSAWAIAGGLTEIARDLPHADERVALDRAAGRVMEMAF